VVLKRVVNSPLKTRRERRLVFRFLFTFDWVNLMVRILFHYRKTSKSKKFQDTDYAALRIFIRINLEFKKSNFTAALIFF
jgi:hypothetical protein